MLLNIEQMYNGEVVVTISKTFQDDMKNYIDFLSDFGINIELEDALKDLMQEQVTYRTCL